MIKMGPVARLVAEPDIDLEIVHQRLEEALAWQAAPDGKVSLLGAVWVVSAKAP